MNVFSVAFENIASLKKENEYLNDIIKNNITEIMETLEEHSKDLINLDKVDQTHMKMLQEHSKDHINLDKVDQGHSQDIVCFEFPLKFLYVK